MSLEHSSDQSTQSVESELFNLTGRVLYLTQNPELIVRQLEGDDIPQPAPSELAFGVSTDEIAPNKICLQYTGNETDLLGSNLLTGFRGGVIQPNSIFNGGFEVVVAGPSFGRGSSRYHAPLALREAGIRVIVSEPERIFGENAVNAGGMITVVAGLLLFMSALLAPEYGIIARQIRVLSLSLKVLREDIIAEIYRYNEKNIPQKFSMLQLKQIAGDGLLFKTAIFQLLNSKLLVKENNMLSFSEAGQKSAELIIRSHRLWESFLVEKAGLQPDHVHSSASKLEHFTKSDINQQLSATVGLCVNLIIFFVLQYLIEQEKVLPDVKAK